MPYFGDLEAAIMDVVWAADGPVRVRDVLQRLERDRPLAYTTVQTVMEVLHRKGWLRKGHAGRAHTYTPTGGRDDYVAALVDEALADAEDKAAVLLRFVDELKPAEAAELQRLLASARAADAGR